MTEDWDREAFLENDLPPRAERSFRSGREIIVDAVDEHGEEWVIDHYYPAIAELGILVDIPDKADLPFFDPEEHELESDAEVAEMARVMREYRQNLRAASETE